MKVRTSTTTLIELNNYLPSFTPACMGQIVIALPDDDVEEVSYHEMFHKWREKMTKHDNSYLYGNI